MIDFFNNLFSYADFMPHGHCYFWRPEVVWLHVISDALITLAYYSIPLTLWIFVRKRSDLPFHWLFIGFAIFIFGCGTTHLVEVITVWKPIYRVAGIIKALTALASVATAIATVWILPMALALRSPKELMAVNKKLETTQREMQKSMTQLEQVNQELESFSYTVSHDLRAPLRHIDGFVGLLGKSEALKNDASAQRYMKQIAGSAVHMSALVDDLLAFSRVGRSEMHQSQIDFNLLVREVIGELAHDLTERKIDWNLGKLPVVTGDPSMLRLVWVNLISNALKYSRPRVESRIEIGVLPESKESTGSKGLVFYVRDNGVGFDMQYADKLFGVFQRLHRADEFEGTGIGLANAQRIIHRHGGRIWVESKLDEGASFYFSLPYPTVKKTT